MSKRTIQQSRLKIPGRTPVLNVHGRKLPCCWDDCDAIGYDEIKVVVREPGKELSYVFCSERHKSMHLAGHVDYGNTKP